MIIINENILAVLRTFSNLQKNYETLYIEEITSKVAAI